MTLMNIAVCINQVPDTASGIEVVDSAPDIGYLNKVLNPYDEYAIEEAIRLKELHGDVMVTAFSVGDKKHYDVLRKALSMGADRACLIEGGCHDDSRSVAASLGKAIRLQYEGLPDLVVCGRESSDCNRAQVPLMLAEMLGAAAVTAVTKLLYEDGVLRVWREIEGGIEEYALYPPAVISAEKGLNIPRKTNIKAVMKARKEPVLHIDGTVEASQGVLYRDFSAIRRQKNCRFLETAEDLVRILHEERRIL
ncbi:electron transfer flavoprotein subunit beta [Prosthecochloris marina]|uniref:Electron transfer flavoprotein subunit beta n=2 Tax=Prosthecochloris marina TaxID=2017681 RepID=A0A317T6I5_9CHLB|nr:electron transfer flavoprotein subunit beta [Prosthecochloris marina]